MARTNANVKKEELIEALKEADTQKQAGEVLGITQSYVSQLMKKFGIDASVTTETPRDEKLESPSYSYEEVKKRTADLMELNRPTIGYDEVDIRINTDNKILLIPQADWHIGARWVYYDRLEEDIEFIRDWSNVFTGLCGDYCDNYDRSHYRGGKREQQLENEDQKAFAEAYIKELKGKILWFLNGCHDEWSYINDGFDLAQFLSHKDGLGYYMGHNGLIHLQVGEINYDIYVTHNTQKNSSLNHGHGLKWVCRETCDFDVGIKAHNHQPHVEDFIMRKQRRFIVSCGTYKGKDRYGSKQGFPPLKLDIPGILLHPTKKEIITAIDYKELIKYL